MSKNLFIILPVTLFRPDKSLYKSKTVVIVEHPVYFGRIGKAVFNFSKPKLAYTKATLLAHHEYLNKFGIPHEYVDLKSYPAWRSSVKNKDITFFDPVDKICVADLKDASKTATVLEAPNFLTSEADMKCYVDNKPNKNYFHKHFYEWQRKRTGILMQNGKPIGGKYSYDPSNRKPLPRGHRVPLPPKLGKEDSACWRRASDWVLANFPDAPGVLRDDALRFPVTYKGARVWLKQFLKERIRYFGKYEDAIGQHQPLLYHSGCSPMLLVGLLTPQEILKELFKHNDAPIEATEGYFRQLIWREFCRLTYTFESDFMENSNYLNANRKLKKCWYDGTTGIPIVDDTIKDAFQNGYLHHILRLMCISNIFQLINVHPHEIFKWFLEFAVDSNTMIMQFNTLSMSSFATGPKFTGKPYTSSSNYLLKMSDYPPGDWCSIWDSLYYNYWMTHYEKLKHVRQGQFAMGRLKRISNPECKKMQNLASSFIKNTTLQNHNA